MSFFKKLFEKSSNNQEYYATHNIGGLLIDVEGILNSVFGFESHAEVPYLKKFVINNGKSKFPQIDNYIGIIEKIGIINNDSLVLKTDSTHLPTVYFTLDSCENYIKHSVLGSEFFKKLKLSKSHIYNGLL